MTMHARIVAAIRKIPRGKVSTYGAIARTVSTEAVAARRHAGPTCPLSGGTTQLATHSWHSQPK